MELDGQGGIGSEACPNALDKNLFTMYKAVFIINEVYQLHLMKGSSDLILLGIINTN